MTYNVVKVLPSLFGPPQVNKAVMWAGRDEQEARRVATVGAEVTRLLYQVVTADNKVVAEFGGNRDVPMG